MGYGLSVVIVAHVVAHDDNDDSWFNMINTLMIVMGMV